MGYTQRLIIGILVIIYSYSLFQDAFMRFQFHQMVAKISEQAQIQQCYNCTQQVRNIIAAFIFASGLSLVFDVSVRMAIISQLFFVGFTGFNFSGCFCYGKIQTALIHLLMLLVLLANTQSKKCKSKNCVCQKCECGDNCRCSGPKSEVNAKSEQTFKTQTLSKEQPATQNAPKRQGRKK